MRVAPTDLCDHPFSIIRSQSRTFLHGCRPNPLKTATLFIERFNYHIQFGLQKILILATYMLYLVVWVSFLNNVMNYVYNIYSVSNLSKVLNLTHGHDAKLTLFDKCYVTLEQK